MSAKPSSAKQKRRRRPASPTPKPPPVVAHSPLGPIDPGLVRLVPSRGTTKRGGGPGGEAWVIEACGERAGTVFINLIEEPPIGKHASLQIFLNRESQGRQIGRLAYRKACEASQYDVIYAHMRKSNIASRRAAEEAGFADVTPVGHSQLIMKHVGKGRSPSGG
ncbi:GNAT family N-acetyltransferase [Sphingomonas sp. S-NIH.Pt3_0716]|nr:GNAT family N-acetyltransferase [Sphingomonas sp. S-NIH.Pt3_0716]